MNILTLDMPRTETFYSDKLNTTINFIKNVSVFAKNKVVDFFTGFYNHMESIAVLTLSSLGLSSLIGELPFFITLPWWVETPMVIPVLSVGIIWSLVTIGEKRAKKRLARA